jgi:hypothetical protein
VQGSRYVQLEDVAAMYCAGHGIETVSYDYGLGALTTNNSLWRSVSSLSNAGNGYALSGGDSEFAQMHAGFNALNGFSLSLNNCMVNGCFAWNNWLDGFNYTGSSVGTSTLVGCRSYDNSANGFKLGTCGQVLLSGCQGHNNGRDTNGAAVPADTERANFHVAATAQGAMLNDCYAVSSGLYSHYGFFINNTTYEVMLDGARAAAHLTSDFYVNDESKLTVHYTSGSGVEPIHPGFKAGAAIHKNNSAVTNIAMSSFNSWQSISTITANVLPVTTHSTIALNCTGAQTVNDITYSGNGLPLLVVRNSSADSVTFTHNTAKLRCANATDVVLAQYESVMFIYVSGTVWQQVGGAS